MCGVGAEGTGSRVEGLMWRLLVIGVLWIAACATLHSAREYQVAYDAADWNSAAESGWCTDDRAACSMPITKRRPAGARDRVPCRREGTGDATEVWCWR